MTGVLFLCTGNACRSQMAEGFARQLAPLHVRVFNAGTESAGIDPRTVEAMAELGIDLREQRSKHVSEVPLGDLDLVVTLCGEAAERCPVLPGAVERAHWPLPDPAAARASDEEIRAVFREIRDEISERVRALFADQRAVRAVLP